MADATPTFHPSPRRPALTLPAGACDTHCHVFGPEAAFPYAPNRTYTPPAEAPKEKLFALHKAMGIARSVIVQAGCHGFDNAVVEDAIAAGQGNYLGVALLPVDVPDAELRRLDAAGFRGVRFNFMRHLGKGASIDDVVALSARLEPLGWHLQLHMESALLEEMIPAMKRSAVPVVIDHMARVDAGLGLDQPAFTALRRLLDDQRFWVKVSGSERATRLGPPYADAVPFAAALVAEHADRTLWGTDWPHPNFNGPVPDDGELVDLLATIAPNTCALHTLLVDNPSRLYRFPEPA